MGTRPFSGANAGATASADPDVFRSAVVVVAAAAGLVWALCHGSSESARDEPAQEASPDAPTPSR